MCTRETYFIFGLKTAIGLRAINQYRYPPEGFAFRKTGDVGTRRLSTSLPYPLGTFIFEGRASGWEEILPGALRTARRQSADFFYQPTTVVLHTIRVSRARAHKNRKPFPKPPHPPHPRATTNGTEWNQVVAEIKRQTQLDQALYKAAVKIYLEVQ